MEKIQRKYKDFTGWSNELRGFTTIQCHLGVSIILMSPLCIYYHVIQTDDCSFILTVMKFDASLKTIRVCVEVNVTMFTALILIFLLLLMWVKRKLTTGFVFYFPPCTLTCHYVHLFSCSSALIFYQPITLQQLNACRHVQTEYQNADLKWLWKCHGCCLQTFWASNKHHSLPEYYYRPCPSLYDHRVSVLNLCHKELR